MREIKVICCPFCGEMWYLDKNEPLPEFCHCFRCNNNYFPTLVIIMWKWVYELCKKVKGE